MNCTNRRLVVPSILLLSIGLFAQDPQLQVKPGSEDATAVPFKAPVDHPPAGVPGQATGGNTWFDATSRDLGTYYGEGEAVGQFPFKNPGAGKVEWVSMVASCQCAKAIVRVGDRQYRLTTKADQQPNQLMEVVRKPGEKDEEHKVRAIEIGPGESGYVEVHLDMRNITGPKQASIDVHTNDQALPHTKLSFHATGAQMFAISPKEVQLNKMTWNETKEFSVTVTSPLQKDWNIDRMEDAGTAFDVHREKAMNGDTAVWTIRGKYGPVNSDVGGGGLLKFHTDIATNGTFSVRVMAFVQGPLEVKPGGFLPLGLVRKGSGAKKEIVFEPNDGVNLEATDLQFEKLSMAPEFVTATSRKDGEKLIVELTVADSAPAGLVKGELVVHLNHPLVQEKRIMFNGFVR